jgi:hypothetical protein
MPVKRESYYHPARMYVFLSFIFFLVLSFMPDEDKIDIKENGKELTREEKQQVLDSVKIQMDSMKIALDTVNWNNYDPKTIEEYDSLENLKPEKSRDGAVERYFTKKFIKLKQENGDDEKALWRRFLESFLDNIPKMIFLLLPIFALLLKTVIHP